MNFKYMTLIMSGVLVLSACGKDKADATKPYDGIALTPATGAKAEDQITRGAAFNIQRVSGDSFSEGDQGVVRYKVTSNFSEITTPVLELAPGAPSGMVLVKSPTEAGVYSVQWTPPTGFSQSQKSVQYTLVAKDGAPASQGNIKFRNSSSESLSVVQNKVEPEIKADTIKAVYEEGRSETFTVSVTDPSGNGKNQAYVSFDLCRGSVNTENPVFDGVGNIKDLKDVKVNGNVYTYSFKLNTDAAAVPVAADAKGNVNVNARDGVNLCFAVSAVSANGNRSPARPYTVRVKYASRAPDVVFDKTADEPLVAGKANNIVFTVKSGSGLGEVSAGLRNAGALVSEPKTKPGINCGASTTEAATQLCTVTYTPSCKLVLPKTVKLELVVTNKLGSSKPKSDIVSKELNITGACEVVAPVAPAAASSAAPSASAASAPEKKTPAPVKAGSKSAKSVKSKPAAAQPAASSPQAGV